MSEIKARFPIGKTQWRKWNNDQRVAFNEAREAGVPYNDAILAANQTQATKKKSILDKIEDVAETAAAVVPVIAAAKTVARVAAGKKGK